MAGTAATEGVKSARVAVIGCGYWGKNLVRDFAGLGALAAVVDDNAALRDALASQHGARGAAFDDVLGDPAIDGVVIATPAETHHALAKRALLAGKHVYVEKPLALNSRDGAELAALAASGGRILMVGHLLRYHPAFIEMKRQIDAGAIGRLTYVYSNRLSHGIIRREEDVLWSFAPHDISMILALAGETPTDVGAFGAPTLHPSIGDHAQVSLAFPSGLKGHVFCSWLHPFKEQRLVAIGEKGSIVFEDSAGDPSNRLRRHDNTVEWRDGRPVAVKGEHAGGVPLPHGADNPLKSECAHFIECIASGTPPRTDAGEGLRVLGVLERASLALKGASGKAEPAAPRFEGVTIHESAYVDEGVTLGAGTKIWHFSHILGSVEIGRNCNIGQNVVVGPRVRVGDNVKIQNNVSIYEGVTLEDGVFCGPSCVFTNVNNPRAEIVRKSEYRTTLVKRGATIGANATIVCGHTLGSYCFIAAGAVVTKDVPDFAKMAGVPARRIGWMSRSGAALGDNLICPETGTAYRLESPERLVEIEA
jgi:predicted dehydrogenase/acetyltransferase-like isoleucine patch superfamily enzyme